MNWRKAGGSDDGGRPRASTRLAAALYATVKSKP
jgi:hypothetical protein